METGKDARKVFQFDSITGRLYWRIDVGFKIKAGDPAGGDNGLGYQSVMYKGVTYLVHRIIWLMANDCWPEKDIDHIDHDRSNNRLANLRVVSRQENCRNRKLNSNNISGASGVNWEESREKWRVTIRGQSGTLHVGRYDDFDEAVEARRDAEEALGYHENHGVAVGRV